MNNWEDELEWESMDTTTDMIVKDLVKPSVNNINKTLEERKKVEESDNELTNELFDNQQKKINIKDKNIVDINKIKSSGIKILDDVIKKTRNNNKIINKNFFFKNNQKRKIYDEHMFNNCEEKSIDIEDNFFFNQRKIS
jgi:hypothetical protein